MIHYFVQLVAFQLLFLVIYDLFLKKETFFQGNRAYLLATSLISFIIPFVKITSLTKVVSKEDMAALSEIRLPEIQLVAAEATEENSITWILIVFTTGIMVSLCLLVFKLYSVWQLKKANKNIRYKEFNKVVVKDSTVAFSFFKYIFLGDGISHDHHKNIIGHELVHVRQKHSYDLMFFELQKVLFWFNPLIYIYQSRIAELHEFIADSYMAKENYTDQYEYLLSSVFQTKNISFINQFFKHSLIKKRIVMLQKSKSKNIWKLKYMLIVPLLAGMLVYSSCQKEETPETTMDQIDALREALMEKGGPSEDELAALIRLTQTVDKVDYGDKVPYAVIDQIPILPGCENSGNLRQCFQEGVMKIIQKNFKYPLEAHDQKVQGRVATMFTIDHNGEITNIRVRGPRPDFEKEAERLIKLLPKMKPGIHQGKAVSVPFSLPINFKLD